jgi:membrane-associated protease RseP (regulator of RpoE activity)
MDLVIAIVAGIGFFALVMTSIALHEIGHLVPAKLFGVKVTQYFVGFWKTLWSTRRGETEYGLKLVPLGGYVRLVGMYPPGRPGRAGRLADLADDARAAEWADITEADVAGNRLFYQKKTWQKLIIMAGGPAMNILLAFLIFLTVNLAYGQAQPQTTVATVIDCLDVAPAPCVKPPAAAAGLREGDRIVTFNGRQVTSWAQLTADIRANGTHPVRLTVDRPGTGRLELPEVPGAVREVALPDNPSVKVSTGFIGVQPTFAMVKVGPVETLSDMWAMTTASVGALATFPVTVVTTAYDLVSGKPRDANGPISVVGASVVAGEIATSGQLGLGARIATFFSLLGSVNLFVAILNLVPLLPFDGGHMAGAIWEWLRRRLAALAKRPDPGYVDTAKLLPVAYVVGGFLVLAGVVLILADVVSPIRIF